MHKHVWDICAGVCIFEESGGGVLGFDGGKVDLCARCLVAVRSGWKENGAKECVDDLIGHMQPMEYERD